MIYKFDKTKLNGSKVMIAPCNVPSVQLAVELKAAGINVVGFIDRDKQGDNIYTYQNYVREEPDVIIIMSSNYWLEIAHNLSKEKVLAVFYAGSHKYLFKPTSNIFLKKWLINSLIISKGIRPTLGSFIYRVEQKTKIAISNNAKNLKKIKNRHVNQRAFIIGTGPSLTIDDLNKLSGEISFGCNKIFLAYDETDWRPTYYTIEDPLDIAEYITSEQVQTSKELKLFPKSYLKNNDRIKGALHYDNKRGATGENRPFSLNMEAGVYGGESVVYGMMQMLTYMGVKEIYLLGVDFTYFFNKKFNSVYIEGDDTQNHFHPDYRKKGDIWVEPRLGNSVGEYTKARDVCEKHGIKIYNATRGGALEVFERVDFDSLFGEG